MKHTNWLKVLRVILAILFFCPILLFFVDITHKLPLQIHGLLHTQLIPAVLSGMFIGVTVLILLTWLFGRIYCSVICPAGILQDMINRFFCIGRKKKNGVFRFRYHKPFNWLRYVLLAVVCGFAIFGWTELCLLLDPYSNFGRIAANLFRPVVIWGNNLLAGALNSMGNFSLYHITITNITTVSLISSGVALLVFIIMAVWRGRLFCNTLCPVGGILSVFSRFSLFRISIKDSCGQCRACERACKAEAINIKDKSVDMSRCVNCFNCLSTCKKDAINFKPFFLKEKLATETVKSSAPENNSRRTFIATGVAVAASLPVAALNAKQNALTGSEKEEFLPVTPPGSINLERFKEKCTACHLCVTKCPSHVLRPAGLEYGFRYLLKPRMDYLDSYCNYECTICSEVCPTKAIETITSEEKKTVQVGIARFYKDRCIVHTEENDCGACSEHCPTQAVHMVPYKGTLTIPQVEPELCVGCGGCESICPVRPDRAIIIIANKEHLQAEKPKEEEKMKVDVDEFGF
ncbi:MAG: 4Fe-4S dicluster domain-containing protein [Tannerella sp.]|jgi:ferredoxin|nr:4Fe-4S dicluster domain-containing protein [Tannerella sp.]